MEPDPRLQSAIDRCYEVFASYPTPRSLEASPLREAKAIMQTLTSKPLRELSGEEIGPYSGYALTTVGNANDYRHFLPRILEEAVRNPIWMGTEPEVIAGRLILGGLLGWNAEEKGAIGPLFHRAWMRAADLHPSQEDATPWFCGMAILRMDVVRVLEAWRSTPRTNPILQLANFLESEAEPLSKANAGSCWAECDEYTLHLIRQWLLGDAVEEWMLMACDHVSPEEAYQLDQALFAVEEARDRLKAAP